MIKYREILLFYPYKEIDKLTVDNNTLNYKGDMADFIYAQGGRSSISIGMWMH